MPGAGVPASPAGTGAAGGDGARRLLAFLAQLDERHALAVVVVGDLAVEAVVALVGIDLAGGADRAHLALVGAGLAGAAALLAAAQPPVEYPKAPRERQRRAQRAEVLAEELAVEGGDRQQPAGVEYERPLAIEAQRECGLERFDLGVAHRLAHRLQREAEQRDQHQHLDAQQALVHHVAGTRAACSLSFCAP